MWRGGLLAVADADRDGALARHHVAAGEHAGAAGHQRRRHDHGAVALELDAGHARAGTRCRSPGRAPGSRCRPRASRTGRCGCGRPYSSSSITSTVSSGPSKAVIVRSQLIRTPSRSASSASSSWAGICARCAGRRSSPRRRRAGGRRGRRPSRCCRRRRRRRGARSPAARRRRRCAGTPRRRRSARRPGPGCRRAWTGARRPRRRPRRSRPPAARPRGPRPGARSSIRTPRAAIRSHLAVEDVARQAVGRDAVAHHAAGLGPASRISTSWPSRAQVVGGRQPARPGADDEHPPAAAARRAARTSSPARAPGRRGSARRAWIETALSSSARLQTRLARVVADPAVDRRERVVGHQLAPGLLVAARLRVRRARPGCSRRPGSRRCRAASRST